MNRDIFLETFHGPLHGQLAIPPAPRGLAVLALVEPLPEDEALAAALAADHLAVLAMPLLTEQELHFPDAAYNVPLLAHRFTDLLNLLRYDGDTERLPVGLYAEGHAAPAAIRAAALKDAQVGAVACHGGLIDLAGRENLHLLAAPLLMLVDADDQASQTSFRRASGYISAPKELRSLAPGESPGSHVAQWFGDHLQAI
ncbi:MAG TPA: hypothetical protein VFF03_13550 [Rhodocyclaceae bacterium]|nr:hypothetical protein [Rhodocyclaceae bacterium]